MEERDISKLPKWAQQEIKRLRMQHEEDAGAIAELRGEAKEPLVKVDFSPRHEMIPFEADTAVEFNLGTVERRNVVRARIWKMPDGTKTLRIIADNAVSLQLDSSNVFYIKPNR